MSYLQNQKSNSISFEAVCALNESVNSDTSIEANAQCPWKLYAYAGKKLHGKFKITKVGGNHTCTNPTMQSDHRQATSAFICNVIMPLVKSKLDITPEEIRQQIKSAFFIDIPYHRA